MNEINGVICINKPQDFTSFDVVAIMRRAAGTRKIGHGGTLDPMATGVLPIYIGRAAKTADLNPVSDKRYRATFRLGVTTDTEDVWGKVLTKSEKPVTLAEITDAVKTMQGDIMQIPPMYSAVKINGKRLYDLARQGIEVERAARPVTVYSIELSDYDEEKRTGTLDIYCSKGTYIRTLVDDLGEVLGCGAHVTVLRRTAVADYPTEKMMTWDALQALAEQGNLAQLDQHLLPTDTAVSKLPALKLNAEQSKSIGFGQRVKFTNEAKLRGQVRLFSDKNIFLGVALIDDNNVIRPQRLITQSL